MALTRKGTALTQESQESLQQMATRQGQLAPTSPGGAKTIGASPDQSKMTGTPAQKRTVFQQMGDTFQRQQRRTPKAAAATGQQQELKARQERLDSLGQLGSEVQGEIDRRLAEIAKKNAQLQVNEEYLQEAYREEDERQQAEQALQQYLTKAQDPTAGATQEDLVSLADTLGLENVQGLQNFLQGAPETISAIGQDIQAPMTLGELGMDVDMSQAAQDLGVSEEELAAMTPEQLQQQIQNVESQVYSQAEALEAEYAQAPPQRKKQIIDELRQLGFAGVRAAEAEFEELQQAVEAGQTVEVAGQELGLKDVLEDEFVSDALMLAAQDPAALERLEETAPGLADFVKRNQEALEAVAYDIEKEQETFVETQQKVQDIKTDLGDLAESIIGETSEFLTPEELMSVESTLEDSAVFQAIEEKPSLKQDLSPELVGRLQEEGASADQIIEMQKLRDEVAAGIHPEIEHMLGLDPEKFPTLEELESAEKAKEVLGSLDADFLAALHPMIMDDTLDMEDVEYAAENPENVHDIAEYEHKAGDYEALMEETGGNPTSDQLLALFGISGLNEQTIMSNFRIASPEDRKAMMEAFDADGDGNIYDDVNPKAIAKRMEEFFSKDSKDILYEGDPTNAFERVIQSIGWNANAQEIEAARKAEQPSRKGPKGKKSRTIQDIAGDVSKWRTGPRKTPGVTDRGTYKMDEILDVMNPKTRAKAEKAKKEEEARKRRMGTRSTDISGVS